MCHISCQEAQNALFACWREVDINGGINTHRLYEPDGEFWFGSRGFVNREEIRRFYAWRRTGKTRTTRHLVLNPIFNCSSSSGSVTADYTLVIFGGAGDAPIDTAAPNMIADASAHLVFRDNCWLFRRHQLVPVMVGQGSIKIPDELPE